MSVWLTQCKLIHIRLIGASWWLFSARVPIAAHLAVSSVSQKEPDSRSVLCMSLTLPTSEELIPGG